MQAGKRPKPAAAGGRGGRGNKPAATGRRKVALRALAVLEALAANVGGGNAEAAYALTAALLPLLSAGSAAGGQRWVAPFRKSPVL